MLTKDLAATTYWSISMAIKYRYGNIDKYVNSESGDCNVLTKVACIVGKLTVNSLDPQHRPKPALLVACSALTSRATQSTRDEYYGRARRVQRLLGLPCGKAGWYNYRVEQNLPYPVPNLTFPSSTNWEQALRLKIAAEQVSFAENIGEWRESVKMLHGAASIAGKAYRAARQLWHARKSRKRFTGNLKQILGKDWKPKTPFEWNDIASTHLAITYGIRPLLGQLEDVLDQLNRVKMPRKRIQVTVPMKVGTLVHRINGYVGQAVVEGMMSQRAVAYVTFKQDAGDFTAGNLASSIWAGTKLSFMVDWMLDVGGYLESLTALTSVASVCGTVTTKRWANGITTICWPDFMVMEPGTQRYFDVSRGVFTSIPLPSRVNFRFGDPSGATWDQLVSATEILYQLRRGRTSFFGD